MIYELKIVLKDVGLPVYRDIQLDGQTTFEELHEIIQVAFEWSASHLFGFFVARTNGKEVKRIRMTSKDDPNESFWSPSIKQSSTYYIEEENIAGWFQVVGDQINYVYDYGDDWQHEITLTKIIQPKEGDSYPRCINAKNIAPPEDSRGELLAGDINLEFADSKKLVEKVNNDLEVVFADEAIYPEIWEEVLKTAKEFHRQKPWKNFRDDEVFTIVDPVTKENLFCSVLGAGEETFGLAVYIGQAGLQSLIETATGGRDSFSIMLKQRSLLLSFEDREDLARNEYKFIKSFNTNFRGKKAWPLFISYVPGYNPWEIDAEEARLLIVAMSQTLEVLKEIKSGLELSGFFEGSSIVKVPCEQAGNIIFQNEIWDIERLIHEQTDSQVELEISELSIKRLKKNTERIKAEIEFNLQYVDLPVQEDPNERPRFPVLSIAADHTQGMVIYQDLLDTTIENKTAQQQLVNLFQTIEGIPDLLYMNEQTFHQIEPLVDELNLSVEITQELTIINELVNGLHNSIPPF
ncbi:plasmid pRiA4b ORF-3 family protein [Virgibacillus halodenitrificans]|uniref:plasmid pRiA4b ORF-3 family protein n=1 Tax=Virgibacillus halodenitrificans TaxID=1482 RepID=UPI001FB3467A|nr:plasmid pRiA4b ORF-3 family protein [Virgibacillus halodenitrificans]MCJ0932905.1 plasmid pRiA4b ORF-3 family protein [Virgibacillus halodenitrificans]